jgi:hypothetical protein
MGRKAAGLRCRFFKIAELPEHSLDLLQQGETMKKRNFSNIATLPIIIFLIAGLIIITEALSGAAQAELVDNGGGLIYDTDLNVTWYIPDVNPMTWNDAVSWVAGLTVNNGKGSNITGWRLPSVLNEDGTGPCSNYNCIGSEFGHLYYTVLGNAPGGSITNKGPFDNLKAGVYWSALQWASYQGNAWAFNYSTGRQGFADKNLYANFYPMAVHDGNVGGSVQPVRTAGYENTTRVTAHPEKTTLRISQIVK